MIGTAQPKKETRKRPEDTLAYLPREGISEYKQQQIIYDEQHPSTSLFLILEGRVKVTISMGDGSQAVIGLLRSDDFFGEMALLGGNARHSERAIAMEHTMLISWTAAEIESQLLGEAARKRGKASAGIAAKRRRLRIIHWNIAKRAVQRPLNAGADRIERGEK
jgi:CRP-like cAMP-binding protein